MNLTPCWHNVHRNVLKKYLPAKIALASTISEENKDKGMDTATKQNKNKTCNSTKSTPLVQHEKGSQLHCTLASEIINKYIDTFKSISMPQFEGTKTMY